MSDIKEAMKLITGTEPSPEQVQKISAIAHALDIQRNDPMLPILAALEAYHGVFTSLPENVASAANKTASDAAKSAAVQAQAAVNEAVAALVPTVENAVSAAATAAVARVQLGESLLTIWGGMMSLSLLLGLGWVMGAHIFSSAQTNQISWSDFFLKCGWGIGIGASVPGLFLIAFLHFDEEKKWWQYLAGFLSLAGMLMLLVNFAGLL